MRKYFLFMSSVFLMNTYLFASYDFSNSENFIRTSPEAAAAIEAAVAERYSYHILATATPQEAEIMREQLRSGIIRIRNESGAVIQQIVTFPREG